MGQIQRRGGEDLALWHMMAIVIFITFFAVAFM